MGLQTIHIVAIIDISDNDHQIELFNTKYEAESFFENYMLENWNDENNLPPPDDYDLLEAGFSEQNPNLSWHFYEREISYV